ncbi:acyltransferase family protein [Marinobacter sp. NFXS9]|uniref:acyltransferase family protein n=1 Tax=Marinobacter sp. NFXS9 TaxID=2818433 RepID=UPI0032DE49B5
MRAKDRAIETLRAIAIILVVALHITNDGPLDQARSFYDYFAYTFQNIRLPLFTVISGYLYGLRPAYSGVYSTFVLGKIRRIIVPLVTVVTLEIVAKSFLPGVTEKASIDQLFYAIVYPYEHFWFLQVIFLIFLFVGFLDKLDIINSFSIWGILFIFSCCIYVFYPFLDIDLPIFSLGTTSYLLPFFSWVME